MKPLMIAGLLTVLVSPGAVARPVEDALHGVVLGASVNEVHALLQDHAAELERIAVDPPRLPLAGKTETHILCRDLTTADGKDIAEVVFTFGDDRLGMIEARGGAVKALMPHAQGDGMDFNGYRAHFQDLVLAHTEQDAVWILDEGAAHAYLFLRPNPLLPSVADAEANFEPSAAKPAILKFGGALEDLLPGMNAASLMTERQIIPEPWLPTKPERQTQINCYGVEYAGYLRKIEAVFGDDVLQLAWILTGEGEEERVRQALVKAYGDPEFVSDDWEAFAGWRVALRKDKPEVLMLSEELAPIYAAEYGK